MSHTAWACVAEVEVIIEKFETSWRDVDGLKWVVITQISKAKFVEEVDKNSAPQIQPIAVVEIQEAAFWYVSFPCSLHAPPCA